MNNFNNPRIEDGKVRRFVHQPVSIDHNGIHAKVQANGKILLNKVAGKDAKTGEIEYDEIEVPASLIFKLASLLRMTRTVQFVALGEAGDDNTRDDA